MCRGNSLWEGVGYTNFSGNKDREFASKSALKDFTVDELTIAAGSLFQNGTARALNG